MCRDRDLKTKPAQQQSDKPKATAKTVRPDRLYTAVVKEGVGPWYCQECGMTVWNHTLSKCPAQGCSGKKQTTAAKSQDMMLLSKNIRTQVQKAENPAEEEKGKDEQGDEDEELEEDESGELQSLLKIRLTCIDNG